MLSLEDAWRCSHAVDSDYDFKENSAMSLSQEQIRAALRLGPRPKPQFGHNRSHAMNATKRQFKPNLQSRRVRLDGTEHRVKLTAREIRTLTKRGTVLLARD